MVPSSWRICRERLPFGKAARATRAVSSGTEPMICGCSDMLLLLFTVCSVASISRVFSILANRSSPVHRLQGFANGIVCYGNPYPSKWLCLHQWLLITDFACNLTIRLSCHCHYLLRVEPYYASNTASGDR